jgi:hypothetical protein
VTFIIHIFIQLKRTVATLTTLWEEKNKEVKCNQRFMLATKENTALWGIHEVR